MPDPTTTLADLRARIERFVQDRDWAQFHNPQNLAVSLSIEAAELLEIFQWELNGEMTPEKLQKVKEELADVIIYSLCMANRLDLDVSEIVLEKVKLNEKKYPMEKAKGSSKKLGGQQ
jgi:NTP pyrophosphatase (non-canonical NTP hydrolase)